MFDMISPLTASICVHLLSGVARQTRAKKKIKLTDPVYGEKTTNKLFVIMGFSQTPRGWKRESADAITEDKRHSRSGAFLK